MYKTCIVVHFKKVFFVVEFYKHIKSWEHYVPLLLTPVRPNRNQYCMEIPMGMEIPMEVGSDNITGFPMGPLEISCHWKYNGVVEIQWGKGTPMGYGNSNGRSLVGPRQGVSVCSVSSLLCHVSTIFSPVSCIHYPVSSVMFFLPSALCLV